MPTTPIPILVTGDAALTELTNLKGLIEAAVTADTAVSTTDANLVVIDDLGGEFRNQPAVWPKAIRQAIQNGFIIHKMSPPLATGALWSSMGEHRGPGRLTIIHADDLRAMQGVNISRALSWERTAKDFSHDIRTLEQFSQCPFLIVLFGTDGAILYRNELDQVPEAVLIFDPHGLEGTTTPAPGADPDRATAIFAASISSHVAEHQFDRLEAGIADGLAAVRSQLTNNPNRPSYAVCEVETAAYGDDSDPDFWRIIDQQTRSTRLRVAEQIVLQGSTEGLENVPRGKFGGLETIDRAEIENYSAIRELISEYINHPDPPRPLCIAVFGPPGAGKSFGVKQVIQSLNAGDLTSKTFNISQYSGYDELAKALHEVKDIGLAGELPFIFFDEFDSALDGKPLAWLASFLAPMNDGEFKDRESVHPIGKAIFVFAGGTAPTLDEFSRFEDEDFVKVKGPDFVSRLRGFVNVMGPNRQHVSDNAYILRRALVLRGNFVRNVKTRQLVDERGTLSVDPGVLRAMLHTTAYKHGMRSMEALLDMSRIGSEKRFNLAALPSKGQLGLHVDAKEFIWLTQCERYQNMIPTDEWPEAKAGSRLAMESEFVERVAEQIFKNVIKSRNLEGKDIRLSDKWESLSDAEQQSFRDSAIDIPAKLRAANHGIRRIAEGASANVPDISDAELNTLAELEHNRRCQYLRLNGYSYGEETNKEEKTSTRLVPFKDMPLNRVNHYIQGIYGIPVVLQALGLEIYRMEEHLSLKDAKLLGSLARLIHEDYVRNETARGATVGTNASLVDYDELPADKQAANIDNAASIPKKLHRIGYRMVERRPGEASERLELKDEQILELAEMEHSRWVWQALMQGWTYQPDQKSPENKTNPYILPWDQLNDETKQLDIDTVKLIPELLERGGYKPVPLP